jgi:hypothetical protein
MQMCVYIWETLTVFPLGLAGILASVDLTLSASPATLARELMDTDPVLGTREFQTMIHRQVAAGWLLEIQ